MSPSAAAAVVYECHSLFLLFFEYSLDNLLLFYEAGLLDGDQIG